MRTVLAVKAIFSEIASFFFGGLSDSALEVGLHADDVFGLPAKRRPVK